MILILTILLTLSVVTDYEGVTAERARAFFTALYHPQVHYDSWGNVKMEGSPLTAGHIYPRWSEITGSIEGKGRKERMVFRVPVNVEREIYTKVASYSEYVPHEKAERELVISCRVKDGRQLWTAVLRYRIIDPDTHVKGRFTGLEIDVNPNNFTALNVKEYRNGYVIMHEKDLTGYRWLHLVYHPKVGLDGMLSGDDKQADESQNSIYQEAIGSFYEEAAEEASLEFDVYGRASAKTRSVYVPVLSLPEVWSAITRFRYFPVTQKRNQNL